MTELLPPGAEPVAPFDDAADAKIAEAISRIAARGYPGRFEVTGTRVRCTGCRSNVATDDVRWQEIEIVAGLHRVSVVGGLRCPVCHERGTATTSLDLLNS